MGRVNLGVMPMVLWGIFFVVVAALAYVRLAPVDPQDWHKQAYPSGMGERPGAKSFVWREPVEGDGAAKFRQLAKIISAAPRSTLVAGSVEAGQMTFVTRTPMIGFPDYTTIGIYQGLVEDGDIRYLEVYGRSRFGRSDLGVNGKRIKGWLAALE
ncbi:DUF1499 domain-containing protein [Sulfitobacter pacificus]|uniref:DUF1499 domain-containing protein n=1 Tax=Sulfitobacter pacificus TaxID=1499314 RepID=UPI0031064A10